MTIPSPGPYEAETTANDEALALYALGVPTAALARHYGMLPSSLRRLASRYNIKRPSKADCAHLARVARAERIRRNIEDYPGRSLFSNVEAAA